MQANFDKPFRLVAVQIFNGSSRQDKDYLKTGRPANVMLTITTADGSVERRALKLRDEPTQQDHLIGINDVTRVRMTVRSAVGASPKKRIAIGEVAYFTRG
nr:hypothetical protein [Kribbia dieselivorans]